MAVQMQVEPSADALREREVRAIRFSQKLCRCCGEPNDRHPNYYCSECLPVQNEIKHIRNLTVIAKGKCPKCGGKLDRDGYSCIKCNNAAKESVYKTRQKREEKGQCILCGEPNPRAGEFKTCGMCQ